MKQFFLFLVAALSSVALASSERSLEQNFNFPEAIPHQLMVFGFAILNC
jgi:hypothetical protein